MIRLHKDSTSPLIAFNMAIVSLAAVAVALRLWARITTKTKLMKDDFLIVISLVSASRPHNCLQPSRRLTKLGSGIGHWRMRHCHLTYASTDVICLSTMADLTVLGRISGGARHAYLGVQYGTIVQTLSGWSMFQASCFRYGLPCPSAEPGVVEILGTVDLCPLPGHHAPLDSRLLQSTLPHSLFSDRGVGTGRSRGYTNYHLLLSVCICLQADPCILASGAGLQVPRLGHYLPGPGRVQCADRRHHSRHAFDDNLALTDDATTQAGTLSYVFDWQRVS